ncbi:MAG: radical SAM protein [Rhodospirillales bacterium]|nr:radical SAM protein [Rhodospirillales bacterium]
MTMKVLLFKIRGYIAEENRFGYRPWAEMPSKLVLAAAWLENLGYEVTVRDDEVYQDDFFGEFDVAVAFVSIADGLYECLDYLRVAKMQGCKTAFALFDDWADMQRQVMVDYPFVDFGIRGIDTEFNLGNLIEGLRDGAETGGAGLVWRRGEEVVDGGPAFQNPENLHYLPSARRWIESLRPDEYEQFSLQVASGCPFKCTFCHVGRRSLRFRKVEHVLDELEAFPDGAEVRMIATDFLANPEWARSLAEGIVARNINLRLDTDTRINWLDDRETLKRLKDAGFYKLAFGVESYHPRILKALKKGYSREIIDRGIETLIEVGITPGLNMLVGSPLDDDETLAETEGFIRRLPKEAVLIGVQYLRATPETEIYDQAVELGLLPDGLLRYQDMVTVRDAPNLPTKFLSVLEIATWKKRLENAYFTRAAAA